LWQGTVNPLRLGATAVNHQNNKMNRLIRSIAGIALAGLASWQTRGATFEVGPGQTYTNLGSVPWPSLAAGDTVNVHSQPGGYHEIVQLSNSGAPGAPITLNGIPDPVTGALPVIDGDNAVSSPSASWRSASYNTAGLVVVSRSAGTSLGYLPSWITIQNLHLQNADPSQSLVQSDGTTNSFASSAAGIYLEFGQNILVHGCEISECANGFFAGSEDNSPFEFSANVTLENSWIHDNGVAGDYSANNVQTESRGLTVQYNLIGPMRAGADGDHFVDRSSGTVIRYNLFLVGPNGGCAIWVQQTRNAVGIIDVDPAYQEHFVYGNVFYNPPSSGCGDLFFYDSVYINGPPRNGTFYFYNNTVVNQSDQSAKYGVGLFGLPTLADQTQFGMNDTVDCRNNIFASIPETPGANPSFISVLGSDASNLTLGTNWFSPGFQFIALPYLSTNYFGVLSGTNETLVGPQFDPGFVDVGATNFMLATSSPAIDAAGPQAPAVAGSTNDVFSEYVFPTGSTPRLINGLAADLGAFEGVSPNAVGPLHNLSVNHGLGSGAYGAGVVVPILAAAPPAGQVFANWAGATVANPASVGTTVTMPTADASVTAVYSNAPPPTHYTLTVNGGTGGGSYLSGAFVPIGVGTPPNGTAFAGWTGYAVLDPSSASTTVVMPASNVVVTANFTNVPAALLYLLTVVNGSGGGSYAAGSTIAITAETPGSAQAFGGWTGYSVADSTALATTLVMPAAPITVTATYLSTRPLPSSLPRPVTSHPHVWLTTNDIPRLRSWAVSANPIYQQGFLPLLQQCLSDYQTQFFPGGVANPNYPDYGDVQGYTGLLGEEYALILSFASLIHPDPATRAQCAGYARNLIMYSLNQAALGHLAGAPFRDPAFAVYNRGSGSVPDFPLVVDWIYNATDTNGVPVLSAADKATIQQVFLMWSDDCVHASTTGGDHPEPIGTLNNPALLPGGNAYRMAANNYYAAHARLMTLMTLAVDPADDPLVDPSQPVGLLGNSLRSYFDDVVGAWMYQQYAMFGEGSEVVADYALAPGASVGLCAGGLPPEGMLYGESSGTLLEELLAMKTSGYGDLSVLGPQGRLLSAPVWGRFCSGMVSSIVPNSAVYPSMEYAGPVYEIDSYGDVLRLWVTPGELMPFAILTLLEQQQGVTTHRDTTRWWATEVLEGGPGDLINRVAYPWAYGVLDAVLYYLTLDPTLPPVADPRPALPLAFYDPGAGRIVDRTVWSTNCSQFDFLASWISINHQQGSAGQFELYRKGEWLTKEVSNYDNNENGQSTMWHNSLALQNACPDGIPSVGFELPLFTNGSEWVLNEAAGDPVVAASHARDYTFAVADLAPLFNRPDQWDAGESLVEITQATRFVLWVKPDHIVVYDRATSTDSGLFKRFNLNWVNPPTISGNLSSEVTPGGQQLFCRTLLPANATITYVPLGNSLTTVAGLEPSVGRIVVEDPTRPADTRFLHVIQGADGGLPADPAVHVATASGDAFEGAAVRGTLALFPVNALPNGLSGFTVALPAGVTNVCVAGLTPLAGHTITVTQAGGSAQVTVAPGGSLVADTAGLLEFDVPAGTLGTLAKSAGPVTAWPVPSPIVQGQTLAFSTLTGGSASVPGAFTWTAPATLPSVGSFAESVTFTPFDAADYTPVTGSVTLIVNPAGYTPPVASPIAATTHQNEAVQFAVTKVLAQAANPSGYPLSVTAVGASAQGGTVALAAGLITYTPPTGFTGTDSFSYSITDTQGGVSSAVITVTVMSSTAVSLNVAFGPVVQSGQFVVRFAGIPGLTYTIEYTDTLSPASWQKAANATAPTTAGSYGVGIFQFSEPAGVAPTRYYRTVYPAY